MQIMLNGKDHQTADTTSVQALLESLDLDITRVIVERNREIVERSRFADTLLHDGDLLEIVQFVGGG